MKLKVGLVLIVALALLIVYELRSYSIARDDYLLAGIEGLESRVHALQIRASTTNGLLDDVKAIVSDAKKLLEEAEVLAQDTPEDSEIHKRTEVARMRIRIGSGIAKKNFELQQKK